jgi:hypothetical protein
MKAILAAVSITAAIGVAIAGSANAAVTIILGLQEAGVNGGAIKTIGSGPSTGYGASLVYGAFDFVAASGSGLASATTGFGTTVDASISTAPSSPAVLNVYLTEQGLTGNASFNLLSGLTANGLSPGWTVTETVYSDAGNGVFTTVDQLATDTFSAASAVSANFANSWSGTTPYSITEYYKITAPAAGYALASETVAPVPEVSTWAMLLAGFAGLWLAGLRRNKRARPVEA